MLFRFREKDGQKAFDSGFGLRDFPGEGFQMLGQDLDLLRDQVFGDQVGMVEDEAGQEEGVFSVGF